MRRIKRVLSSLLLLALFTAYQASITMFTHVHYVNGVMIVHSHPSKDNQHTHAKAAIVVINRLSVFQLLEADAHTYIPPFRQLLSFIEPQTEIPVVSKEPLRSLSLRAPPASCTNFC